MLLSLSLVGEARTMWVSCSLAFASCVRPCSFFFHCFSGHFATSVCICVGMRQDVFKLLFTEVLLFARRFLITFSSHGINALYVHSIPRVIILLFKSYQFISIYYNNIYESNLDLRVHFSFSEHTICLLSHMKENSHLFLLKLIFFPDLCQQ